MSQSRELHRCAVVGAGSWGTALAIQLAAIGHDVHLWDHNEARAAAFQAARRNLQYLPAHAFPDGLTVSADLAAVLRGARLVTAVVPTTAMREVMGRAGLLLAEEAVVCCASKGVEVGTLKTMAEVLEEVMPGVHPHRITALSGPSFAAEVAARKPTAVVVAGRDPARTRLVADAFHDVRFRVYDSRDVVGVELGGALKNVMAIACGISDGMGLGLNARAGIITRGLAELTRLAVKMGAEPFTMAGLAGIGDLVLTCTGDLSRNRRVGLALGQGRTLCDVLEELGQVAEGVVTARSARDLGRREGVELPITEHVYAVLHEGLSAREALESLMSRHRRGELSEELLRT